MEKTFFRNAAGRPAQSARYGKNTSVTDHAQQFVGVQDLDAALPRLPDISFPFQFLQFTADGFRPQRKDARHFFKAHGHGITGLPAVPVEQQTGHPFFRIRPLTEDCVGGYLKPVLTHHSIP